jgi:hypothetical protein
MHVNTQKYKDLFMVVVGPLGAVTAKGQRVPRMRVRTGDACREWGGRGDTGDPRVGVPAWGREARLEYGLPHATIGVGSGGRGGPGEREMSKGLSATRP